MFKLKHGLALFVSLGVSLSAFAADNPYVVLKTSVGDIEVELLQDKAPVSVANFLKYTKSGFYNGTVFHRVVPGFVVQGGGMTADMTQKPTMPPIQNESTNGVPNLRGTLSMARTAAPHSANSQFFISLRDNASLDYREPGVWGYAVFGRVVSGIEAVDKMATLPTGQKNGFTDVPQTPIVIKEVKTIAAPTTPKPAAAPAPAKAPEAAPVEKSPTPAPATPAKDPT